MKKEKTRRPITSVDIEGLAMLHHEAADHLEMMHHLAESDEYLSGPNRNEIGRIIMNHWGTYMNIMHMISRQDQMMENAMGEYDMDMRKEPKDIPEGAERQFGFFRFPIFPILLFSLAFRHRRRRNFFENFFRRDEFENYLHSTSRMECEHIASLTSMVEEMM